MHARGVTFGPQSGCQVRFRKKMDMLRITCPEIPLSTIFTGATQNSLESKQMRCAT
jgi:hypothetical protein